MSARTPFAPGEWYHCYNRGVDKRTVFENEAEYKRFIELLFLTNSDENIHRSELYQVSHNDIFEIVRGKQIVKIGAYCLMPNHFHLLIQESSEAGITQFMQRLGTAYTMYFNKKYERVGNLFVKPFRSKHVAEDGYFKYVAQYIHLNPAELYESGWKDGRVENLIRLEKSLSTFPYSSLQDYLGTIRPESAILDAETMDLLKEELPSFNNVLEEASLYYGSIDSSPKASPRD